MKKTYAHLKDGRKIFCKYTTNNVGELFIEFYCPLVGFSYQYIPEKLRGKVRLVNAKTSADGRKFLVTYAVHPIFWCGYGFGDYQYYSIQQVIDTVASKMFKFGYK